VGRAIRNITAGYDAIINVAEGSYADDLNTQITTNIVLK
jgi:hypothetical protein